MDKYGMDDTYRGAYLARARVERGSPP